MDLDPVIPPTRDGSSSAVPSILTEDRVQVETPSKVEDDKKASFLNPFKEEEEKGTPLGHSKDPSFRDFADTAPDTVKTSEQGADYNPKRIPSSVFSRTDSTPGDWSNASNESLFSLQGGNVSFGRDHAYLLAAESRKHREYHREESKKIDEVTVVNPLPASDEDSGGKDKAGKTEVVEEEVEVVKQEEVVVQEEEEEEEEESPKEDKPKEEVEKTQKQEVKSSFAVTCHSNVSYRSDGSEGSTFSFAFPILAPGPGQGPSGSAKGETPSPSTQTRHSSEPHSGGGTTTETPPQPPLPSSATKRKGKSKPSRYFSCFSSQSSHSCSCWPFKR